MSQTNGITAYYEVVQEQLGKVLAAQQDQMAHIADLWAQSISADKLVYTFGSGHSRYIAGELYWRAGGLAPVMQIEEPSNGLAERLESYAETFMAAYHIQPGDLLFVISNSGINPVPVGVARYGKAAGATVIAVTNLEHSQQGVSRDSSGQKLYEVADIILDTMGVRGDAVVGLPGVEWKVGPTSTLISVSMLNAIVAQTATNLMEQGITPPVLISANVPEGDAHNQSLSDKYWPRLTHFPRRTAAG
ncbi:sugar isomerase domain-containing protein [Chloroflexota bacterium]